MEGLKFTKTHEWVRIEGGEAVIGITDHAQAELGDVVFVELPAVGKVCKKETPCGNIESVKAVSDVYSPLSGTIVAANDQLSSTPELVNKSPTQDGWLFRMKIDDPAELTGMMDQAQYDEYIKGLA
jgi:glycine cleavage system H protein